MVYVPLTLNSPTYTYSVFDMILTVHLR